MSAGTKVLKVDFVAQSRSQRGDRREEIYKTFAVAQAFAITQLLKGLYCRRAPYCILPTKGLIMLAFVLSLINANKRLSKNPQENKKKPIRGWRQPTGTGGPGQPRDRPVGSHKQAGGDGQGGD